jgi:hypothetical protein
MIPVMDGHPIQARYLLPFDRILDGGVVVEVTEVRAVAVSWSLPPTVVIDWAGMGNVTGCTVYGNPETTVFLLACPPPQGVAA